MDIAESNRIELLAPAGSFASLQAVIEAGCDAVYIGGSRFGARAYADNPEEEELLQALDYAHLRGIPVYLTVNTLLKDTELAELGRYLTPYVARGVDAVIVQDYGVMEYVAKHFPTLPIHISTQMTVTHASVRKLFPKSVTRIVPARELSLADIADMRKETDRELEIFVHGALCYSYSGQCLMSSVIGGRSGNRGRCAQPCRKEYEISTGVERRKAYILSPKDQCLLPRLHELLDVGIHSLKIEGRMKKPEYAAGVTAVYRKWLNRYYELGSQAYAEYVKTHEREMAADVERLALLYNRGGFCDGYVFGEKGPEMMALKRPNHTGVPVGTAKVRRERTRNGEGRFVATISYRTALAAGDVLELRDVEERSYREFTVGRDKSAEDYREMPLHVPTGLKDIPQVLTVFCTRKASLVESLEQKYVNGRSPISVKGMFGATVGEPMWLRIISADGATEVTVFGEVAEAATKASATEEQVGKQLRKTGDTGFAFSELTISLDGACFLPVSQLNDLRRRGLSEYREALLRAFRREVAEEVAVDVASGDASEICEKYGGIEASTLPGLLVSVVTKEQLEAVCGVNVACDVAIDMDGELEACICTAEVIGKRMWLILPRISKGATRKAVAEHLPRLWKQGSLMGVIVRTPDQLVTVREYEAEGMRIPIISDSTLPVMNGTAAVWLHGQGVRAVTLSQELRREEMQVASAYGYLTVYGRTVLMVSEQCVRKNAFGCTGVPGLSMLRDNTGAEFPVRNVCRYCYNAIYNGHITSLLPYAEQVNAVAPLGHRIDFVMENADDVREVLVAYDAAFSAEADCSGVQRDGFTGGHWRRGVQ